MIIPTECQECLHNIATANTKAYKEWFDEGIKSERERILRVLKEYFCMDVIGFKDIEQQISDSQNASQEGSGCKHSSGHSGTHNRKAKSEGKGK